MDLFKILPLCHPSVVRARKRFETYCKHRKYEIGFAQWRCYFRSDLFFAEIARQCGLSRAIISKLYLCFFITLAEGELTGRQRQQLISKTRWEQAAKRFPQDECLQKICESAKDAGCDFQQVSITEKDGCYKGFKTDALWINGARCYIAELKNAHYYQTNRAYFRSLLLYRRFLEYDFIVFYLHIPNAAPCILFVPAKDLQEYFRNKKRYKGSVYIYIATEKIYPRQWKSKLNFWKYKNEWPLKKTE